MRLSPLDIKKQEFNRGFRGFEEQEVAAFLQMLADQWDELLSDHRALESKVTDLENKLVHYQRVEDALQEALNTAKSSSKTKIDNANQEAGLILREAKSKAEELLREARTANQLLHQSNLVLEQRQQHVLSKFKAFLASEMDILWSFEKEPFPTLPDPVELPTKQAESNGKPPHTAVIHNVEIDVEKYSDEVAADNTNWNPDEADGEFAGQDYFEESTGDQSSGDHGSHDSKDSDASHNADRPPQRENVNPAEMDKIRKILDNLD